MPNRVIERLLPRTVDGNYSGRPVAAMVFAILAAVSLGRSLAHLLAADGGAGTIAGLDLTGGGANIVFAFGLWGLAQTLYAIVQLLVAFRYRTLIPLMYLLLIVEIAGRMAIGALKPPVLLHTPPGAIGNYIILPLAAVMLALSLSETRMRNGPG